VHRSLGVQITRVRSLELDLWSDEQLEVPHPWPISSTITACILARLLLFVVVWEVSGLVTHFPDQMVESRGNAAVNRVYEAYIPPGFTKPTNTSSSTYTTQPFPFILIF
jgi:hypothetical protein